MCTLPRSVVATLVAVAASIPVHAQGFGHIPFKKANGSVEVLLEIDNGPQRRLTKVNLHPMLEAAWRNARPKAEKALREQMNGRKLAEGVSIHDADPSLAADFRLDGKPEPSGFRFRVTAATSLYFKTTTPDIDVPIFGHIGLPGGLDPKVRVDADLVVEFFVTAGIDGRASAKAESVRLENLRHHGANATGWLLHAVGDALKFFGGPDVRAMVRGRVNHELAQQSRHMADKMKVEIQRQLPALPIKPTGVVFGMERETMKMVLFVRTKPPTAPQIH